MASEEGSGTETGSDAKKWGSTKFKVGVNTSVLLSVLPNGIKVPLKLASVLPLPKAYRAVITSLLALSWESSSSI